MAPRSRLRLIRGGLARPGSATPRIEIVPRDEQPFPVDALAVEDDTYFVLAASPEHRETADHPLRVMTAAWEAEPAEPGSLLVRGGRPLRLHAVVHDLEREPSWRAEWVLAALDRVLRECARRRLESLALEPLGAVHGRLAPERFVDLLVEALTAGPAPAPGRIWLVAATGQRRLEERLRTRLAGARS